MTEKRVSLAYHNLEDIPEEFTEKHGIWLEEIDLSYNYISDLRFLVDYPQLTTLILDHNRTHSHVKLPASTGLVTLWVNHNHIKNLGTFITTISKSCPKLRFLSMMNNEAAPSYFNGGTYQQFMDYRQYVISKIPSLEALDDKNVTPEERAEAERIYGRRPSKKTKKKSKPVPVES